MNFDEFGRALDCHFFNNKKYIARCDALRIFYNEEKSEDMLCKNCPFYRTTAEYNEAREKAARRVEYLKKKGVIKKW